MGRVQIVWIAAFFRASRSAIPDPCAASFRRSLEMARIVMKFGGTSVADVARVRNAAELVRAEAAAGHQVAVAVSAMAGVTNQLVGYVDEAAKISDLREYDVVVSAGEQVTAGLMAIALQETGIAARSWLGWQVPVHNYDAHGSARIECIGV